MCVFFFSNRTRKKKFERIHYTGLNLNDRVAPRQLAYYTSRVLQRNVVRFVFSCGHVGRLRIMISCERRESVVRRYWNSSLAGLIFS